MEREYKQITRSELCERVWSEPIATIAKERGLSDLGIIQICKMYSIPMPLKGILDSTNGGQKMKHPPLPELERGKGNTISIPVYARKPSMNVAAGYSPVPDEIERIRKIIRSKEVSRTVREHPLITAERKQYKETELDAFSRVCPRTRRHLGIKVSKKRLERAFQLMSMLFLKLELCGYSVQLEQEDSKRTVVTVFGETFRIHLQEQVDRRENNKTVQRELKELGYEYRDYLQYLYIPTGVFSLIIDEYWVSHVPKRWSDTKKSKLEARIGDIIEGLIDAAVSKRINNLEREVWHKELELESMRLAQERRAREEEKKRVEDLFRDAENWKRSKDLRDYIEAVKAKAIKEKGTIGPESEISNWIEWAILQADRLDPFL